MDSLLKRLSFLFLTIVIITISFSARAEYYIVYQGGCCDCGRYDVVYSCCPDFCSGYFEHHAKRAHAPNWAGRSEYAWIPDPDDP